MPSLQERGALLLGRAAGTAARRLGQGGGTALPGLIAATLAPDLVAALGGQLGILGVPAFLFHEGIDPVAKRTFSELARLTKGAYCPFDGSSASQLRDLLRAVAIYAAGGRKALAHFGQRKGGLVRQLTDQMTKT